MITGETTRPNMEETHALASARAFDANAFIETPIDDGRGSAMAAGRFGYTGFLSKLVAPDYGIGYWDYQARAAHKTWGDDVATIFAFGARDDLDYRGQKFFHVEYHRVDARYDHPTKDGHLRAAVTFTADDAFTAEQNDTGVGHNAALSGPGARARVEWERKLTDGARLRAGGDIGLRRFTKDESPLFVRPHHTDVESGVYTDVVWRPVRRVEVVPGFRFDMYNTTNGTRAAPQPRASGRVSITPSLSWVSSFGVTHQEPTEQVYVPAKLPDPAELTARDGYHLEEGMEARLGWRVRLHASAFYTRITASDVGTNERAYGGELFVRRDLSERLGGFLAYTLSRADVIHGAKTMRAPWDRTHLFSMALSYDLGAGFRAGARLYAETGRSYHADCAGPACSTLPPNVANPSGMLPGFFRLDARVEKKWSFDRGRYLTLSMECFNATNNAEPIGKTYTPGAGLVTNTQSPVILPSVGVEVGF